MPIFSTPFLQRLIDEAEESCSSELRCIRSRTTLSIVPGTSVYTLPKGTIGIEQITWLGIEVLPQEQADYGTDSNWFRPVTQVRRTTRPESYLTVGNGYNRIQFYPAPDGTITANDDDVWTRTGVLRRVVIQCIRIAQVDGETVRLPPYLFRHLMKYYAMSRAYAKDGQGQNLTASKYFQQRYEFFFPRYKNILFAVPEAVKLQLTDGNRLVPRSESSSRRGRGSLPTTGAWGW